MEIYVHIHEIFLTIVIFIEKEAFLSLFSSTKLSQRRKFYNFATANEKSVVGWGRMNVFGAVHESL